jgi:NAD(P)-dependent dehydrogenase (short-subunit alcohol dehydrogenase family)
MKDEGLFRLDGRIVAVVGAASGIGEAVARACARQGAHVAAIDVNREGVDRTAARIAEAGGSAESHMADVVDGDVVDALFAKLAAAHGALDGVVSTPSINVRKPLLAYAEEEFDRVLRVNLKGNFNLLRAAGRVMTAQRRGSIVLFSSIRSQVVEPGQGIYAATKAGILQMARAAAAEFGAAGVRVNAVAPGVTETPLTAPIKSNAAWYEAYAAKTVFNRWASADEMAGPTVFLLSDAASYVTGTLLVVDGGWLAVDGRFHPPGM